MIKGPAGNPVSLKKRMPKKEDIIPITIAPKAYWAKFRLRFLAVEAGIATKAAVKRPPTIFTPKATIIAMEPKKIRLYFLMFIASDWANSSEILIRTILE